ncbi:MAG: serine/threonine-protein kinase [Pirellulaceae bacterium]
MNRNESDLTEDAAIAEIADRFSDELAAGQQPDIDAYVQAHPHVAAPLRQLLHAIVALAASQTSAAESGLPQPLDLLSVSNRTLGDFRIGEEIGRGGMGVVYRAHQVSLDRDVALKVFPFASVMDEKHLVRFRNEARAAGTLNHPHIVPIYASGVERGIHYFAMQLIEGQSLDKLIASIYSSAPPRTAGNDVDTAKNALATTVESVRKTSSSANRINFAKWARVGHHVATALAHAHERGVVHRDIKPGNILIDRQGEVWVTDFGLAHLEHDLPVTQSGDLLGTLRYMSPEQAQGSSHVDGRTDIYSLGATLYEMVTGQPAVIAKTRPAMLAAVIEHSPVRPKQICPTLPTELETIILKAMEKSPEDRYQSAADMAEDLRRFQADLPILAKPASRPERLRKWIRRHPERSLFVTVGLLLTVVGLAVSSLLLSSERHRTSAALQSEQQQRKRADRHLELAREAIQQMLTEEAERIGDAPRMTRQQEGLLRNVVEFYQHLADLDSQTPETMRESAAAYARLAEAQTLLRETSSAKANLLHSLELYQRLDQANQATPMDLYHLASVQLDLGRIETQPASDPTSLADDDWLSQAIATSQRITKQPDGESLPWQCHLLIADAYDQQARLAERNGKYSTADQLYQQAVHLAETLLKKFPAEERVQYAAAFHLAAWADLRHGVLGDSQAVELYEQSESILTALVQRQPQRVSYRDRLAQTENNLALALASQGKHTDAEGRIQNTITRRRELWQDFPERPRFARELAASLSNLGMLYFDRSQFAEAELHLQEARKLVESLIESFPDEPDYLEFLAGNGANLGQVYLRTNRLDQYRQILNRSAEQWQQLSTALPNQPKPRAQHAMALYSLALRADMGEAVPLHWQAINELQSVVQQHPNVPSFQAQLCSCTNALGGTYLQTEDWEQAEQLLRASLEQAQALARGWPETVDYRGKVARRWRHLGQLFLKTHRFAEAEDAFRQALSTQTSIAEQAAEYQKPMYVNPLASLHACLGSAIRQLDQNRTEEADQHFEQAAKLAVAAEAMAPLMQQIAPLLPKDDVTRIATYAIKEMQLLGKPLPVRPK